MLIIDENLRSLVEEKKICSNLNMLDNFCLQVRLSNEFYRLQKDSERIIKYGYDDVHELYQEKEKDDNSIILHICRVKCSSHCNKTHALLPTFIVPYSQVSFPDQVEIISCYECSHSYSDLMEKTPSIDENCIHSIIRRYALHWLERVLSFKLSISTSIHFIQLCFSHFSRQFMQIRKTPNILFLTPT